MPEVPTPRDLVVIEMEDELMRPVWVLVPHGTRETDVVHGIVIPFAQCPTLENAELVRFAVNSWTFN